MESCYRSLAAAVFRQAIADRNIAKRALKTANEKRLMEVFRQRVKRINEGLKKADKPPLVRAERELLLERVRRELEVNRRIAHAELWETRQFITSDSIWHQMLEIDPQWFAARMDNIDSSAERLLECA